ncbi:hypothetical protein D3C87_1302160 [compost metagenome]
MDNSKNRNKPDESFRDKAGNALEKAGQKISNAGAPKLGQKIHDLGDKLEKTHRNPDHPRKV